MKDFKDRLKDELRKEAPFTKEIQLRIAQPKTRKKSNWQVLTVTIAACLMIALLFSIELFQESNLQTASENNELLPIIDDVSSLEVIDPQYAELLGEQWMLHFLPMIIDKKASITYGDYVAFYGSEGLIVSTVLGLENDTVTMNHGQILVDNQALKRHGLNKEVTNEEDPFNNPYLFHTRGTKQEPFINKSISTKEEEVVVYQYNDGHSILKINKGNLVGKIIGFQNFELSFELTEQEQRVFDDFKTDYDVNRLKDVTPQAITKMFLLSDIEKDYQTYEALFTTNVNTETDSVRRYYEKTKIVRQKLLTEEVNRLIIARLFDGIENAEFEQLTDTQGVIKYISYEGPTELKMEKNDQGIWQPAFGRGIY